MDLPSIRRGSERNQRRAIGAGVEAFELYVIKGDADDGARSTVTISPSLRKATAAHRSPTMAAW
jgi:hypothetical protein